MKKIVFAILALTIVFACKDDNENDTVEAGTINLEFTNSIDNTPITLNSTSYTNASNESYTIAELKYIISNIVFIKENGDEFTYPVEDSYFLINEEISSSKQISLNDIEAGVYTKIRFGFGVDQSNYPLNGVANFIPTAEEQGMLWSWSAGYKFLKFEGSFTPQGGTAGDFILHIGSHGEALDNYKEITLDLTNTITINGNTSTISIDADIAKIFDSTNTHSLEDKSDIQVDPDNAPKIATNVQTMFEIQ
ncbi:MbnP family protein [Aquimarina litoralis]|uniref:MbnP family protein n=1 Tax=Aquimarina litoralis TaxID=584605 RepID=UPI001C57C709|nr:MbnP family protein [Aquimarina litoralis]MBW1297996.1 hypothetical protein [Aquimarina litoralis]